MAGTVYQINGTVIDKRTRKGIGGLRVEAFDLDTRYHDLLGQDTTRPDGSFTMKFDQDYFGDYAPDRLPDIFFRVWLGEQQVLSTQDRPLMNVRTGKVTVTLEVDMPEPEERKPDRLSYARSVQGIEFVRQSNFRAVGSDAMAKLDAVGGLLGKAITTKLKDFELKPIKGPSVPTRTVVNQDLATAQSNLSKNGITVNEIREYKPGGGETLQAATAFPLRLKAGDKVNLYQENGQVRYYSIVREKPAAGINEADVAELKTQVSDLRGSVREIEAVREDLTIVKAAGEENRQQVGGEVETLRAQVAELQAMKAEVQLVRQQSAEKDRTITSLQEEVTLLRSSHEQMRAQFSPDRLLRLEQAVGIRGNIPPDPAGPAVVVRPRKPK
jgi:hypothetical protein